MDNEILSLMMFSKSVETIVNECGSTDYGPRCKRSISACGALPWFHLKITYGISFLKSPNYHMGHSHTYEAIAKKINQKSL